MQQLAGCSCFSPPPSYLVDAGPHIPGDPHQNVLLSPLDVNLEQGNPASEPQRMQGSEQGGGEEACGSATAHAGSEQSREEGCEDLQQSHAQRSIEQCWG